jgi:hypothetical protein
MAYSRAAPAHPEALSPSTARSRGLQLPIFAILGKIRSVGDAGQGPKANERLIGQRLDHRDLVPGPVEHIDALRPCLDRKNDASVAFPRQIPVSVVKPVIFKRYLICRVSRTQLTRCASVSTCLRSGACTIASDRGTSGRV